MLKYLFNILFKKINIHVYGAYTGYGGQGCIGNGGKGGGGALGQNIYGCGVISNSLSRINVTNVNYISINNLEGYPSR